MAAFLYEKKGECICAHLEKSSKCQKSNNPKSKFSGDIVRASLDAGFLDFWIFGFSMLKTTIKKHTVYEKKQKAKKGKSAKRPKKCKSAKRPEKCESA